MILRYLVTPMPYLKSVSDNYLKKVLILLVIKLMLPIL